MRESEQPQDCHEFIDKGNGEKGGGGGTMATILGFDVSCRQNQ